MDNLKKKFSRIYNQYIDKIYRFVFLKVNSKDLAEDLTSETFLKGWEALQKSQNSNKEEIKNISAFLYKIARNLITDHYREKGKAQIISADYVKIGDPRINLEEKATLISDIDTIRSALVNLKEDYQDVIIWYYLEQFSISEISQILDKSEGAVRVLIHRALKALKDELK
jgi:RNA polymerase sigma-70 factor (ECF subfamily)